MPEHFGIFTLETGTRVHIALKYIESYETIPPDTYFGQGGCKTSISTTDGVYAVKEDINDVDQFFALHELGDM